MKKLVCEKDIQKLVNEGKKVCYVSEDTLVTPSAKDAARTAGIEISYGEEPKACCCEASAAPVAAAVAPAPVAAPAPAPACDAPAEISSDMIYQVLKVMADKGMLGDMFNNVAGVADAPYLCEKDASGLKVVRGSTVRMDEFFEGNPTIMFWHHPDGQYLCIEPWNNSPDFVDAPHDIAKKPNFICLKPGREANRSHTITIL